LFPGASSAIQEPADRGKTRYAPANPEQENQMKYKLPLLALLFAGTFAYAATEGQVYKWTDSSGVTHYSDAPPPKDARNVQIVRVSGGSHSVSMGNAESAEKPAADAASTQPAPANQSTAMAETASNRVKACAQARNNLELLQSKFVVSVAGADGKSQPLDDKGRQSQIADANAQIVLFCK
jgi:Domain of unknown function (DUF4124)